MSPEYPDARTHHNENCPLGKSRMADAKASASTRWPQGRLGVASGRSLLPS